MNFDLESRSSQKRTMNFLQRFKNKMSSVGKQGIHSTILDKSSNLPPINKQNKPVLSYFKLPASRCQTMNNPSRNSRIVLQPLVLGESDILKKQKGEERRFAQSGQIHINSCIRESSNKHETSITSYTADAGSSRIVNFLRLSMPEDEDFKRHMQQLDKADKCRRRGAPR